MSETQPFSFRLLDDLMLLPPQNVARALAGLGSVVSVEAGPVVEYALHQRERHSELPDIGKLVIGSIADAVNKAIARNGQFDPQSTTSLGAFQCEFTPLAEKSSASLLLWRAFTHRLANAAHAAGFDKPTSKGLAGAFGELEDNARTHSERPETAVVGYRWSSGEFEMIVGDAGVGVMQSLRSNREYQTLTDHGEAIRTALSSGETRFGRGSGHGTGFDTVFRTMASMHGKLRFRSGDQSLELEGLSPSLINSKLKQRRHFQGFVASVTCRPK